MTRPKQRQRRVGRLVLAAALFPAAAGAQPTVRPLEVYWTLGVGQVYIDTSAPDHSAAGGGARLFVTRRLAVQGDLFLVRWTDPVRRSERLEHNRMGSVSLVGAWGPTMGAVRPYWLTGISVPLGARRNHAVGPQVGLGARIPAGDRFFFAPEIRGGYGLLIRGSISVGVAF